MDTDYIARNNCTHGNKFSFMSEDMKKTNYCYDVHRHIMPIILWHAFISTVRVRHARLRKIGGSLRIALRGHRIVALEAFLIFFFSGVAENREPHARARSISSFSLIFSHKLVQGDTNLGSPICSRGVVWFGRPSAYTDSRISACRPVHRALCVPCATRSESIEHMREKFR